MSITFPTFIDKEIVTPEKLNDFVQALEAKFAAGLSSAEIVWPLNAGGDLQMGDWNITEGQSIWGIFNADQYTDDWDSCLSDAGSGGCIVIPPNTTVTMDASAMTGSSLTIKGSGPSSILQLEAGATGTFALRNSTVGFSFKLENLTVDGADIGANRGIILQGADDVVIHNVLFKDFPLSSLYLTSIGGVGCSDVKITDNTFEGGASFQIEGDDVADLVIKGNSFKTAAKTAIMLEASGATADMLRIEVEGNNFLTCVGDVISILGGDGNFNAPQAHIRVAGNKANNTNSIKVGSAAKKVQFVNVVDNIVASAAATALSVCAQYGTINGNVMPNAGSYGVDLLESYYVSVDDNQVQDAATQSMTFVDARGCNLHNNDCGVNGTIAVATNATTPCHHSGNVATPESGHVNTYFCGAASFVMPADTLQVGDTLDVVGIWTDGGAGVQGLLIGATTYMISHTSSGAAGEVIVTGSIFVEDETTLNMLVNLQTDNGTSNSGGPTHTGYDLSSTIKFKINGATISNEKMFITIGRGISVP